MFVDRVVIEVEAGNGGDGCMSFRRERYVPKGGPDGGDGGDGGSVIIEARTGVDHLSALAHRKQWKAKRGAHGQGANRTGRKGEDVVLLAPPGTVIVDEERGYVIKDLVREGDSVVVAKGGKGGKGNTHYKSATNQAPRQFTRGEEGESRRLLLELKMIADVGLIGKPNAGKSTLLSRMTRARPQVASYPFTTKHPNLGLVQVDMQRSYVMADIPGLIEGAHEGVGLGHEFLRHIERAGILVHLVEPAPMDGTEPLANYRSIRHELSQYKQDLGDRPEIVAVSKCELPEAEDLQKQLVEATGGPVLAISAATGQGLDALSRAICQRLDKQAQP